MRKYTFGFHKTRAFLTNTIILRTAYTTHSCLSRSNSVLTTL